MDYEKGKLTWKCDVEDWELINLDTYKFVFEQAKLLYDDIIDESITITKKSLSALLIYLGGLSSIISYIASRDVKNFDGFTTFVFIILMCFSSLAIYKLFKLNFPRNIIFKGSRPSDLFYKSNFKNLDFNSEEDIKIVYFRELERYQDRIDKLTALNIKRIQSYKLVLIISLIVIIGLMICLIRII